jgi:hypothetical protein
MTSNGTTHHKSAAPMNPYVGPRAFGVDERLPNREDDARELTDLLTSERVVLLHAPSGAGKTSLIQAAVMPLLKDDGFNPIGPVRVDKPIPADAAIRNRYVYSIALYLLGNGHKGTHGFRQLTLAQVLDLVVPAKEDSRAVTPPPVLIIDQLEEALTLNPADWDVKEQFFKDLGSVLAHRRCWALLAMREDYMGGLDRYLRLVPGHLRTRYRLDFLTPSEALAAAQVPAKLQGVDFDAEAARLLIKKLAKVRVDRPGQETAWLPTPYVEPFQLQVACRRLWKQVRASRGNNFPAIDCEDVERLDVDRALSRYYADSVAEVERRTGVGQGVIREWFETQLITPQQFRSQTTRGPVEDNPQVLTELQSAYLVRGDSRGGVTWYELAHDRLIGAVLSSNHEWRRRTYAPWQIASYDWRRNNRPRALLLSKLELRYAPSYRSRGLEPDDREFLKESEETAQKEGLLSRHRNVVGLIGFIAVLEFVVIVLLLLRTL